MVIFEYGIYDNNGYIGKMRSEKLLSLTEVQRQEQNITGIRLERVYDV